MPLTDLIRYFNSSDLASDSTLYPEGERAAAWHDGLRLRSLFQPIVALPDGRVVGHQAFLDITTDAGDSLSSEAVYAHCQSAESIVHFDRLSRTLHALNFLAQRRHTGGYLQLSIHPRHLLAVPSQHGLVFEAILRRCGLAPDDIVLELAADKLGDIDKLNAAVESYRQRGYRIALTGQPDLAGALEADIVKYSSQQPPHGVRAVCHAAAIDSPTALKQAIAHGASLGQGSLFGEAAHDCRATHNNPRVAYNRANRFRRSPDENRQ
jgi:EAL domain-containing protein (putative c-di-GMP-specific phosphodiesterase class I)